MSADARCRSRQRVRSVAGAALWLVGLGALLVGAPARGGPPGAAGRPGGEGAARARRTTPGSPRQACRDRRAAGRRTMRPVTLQSWLRARHATPTAAQLRRAHPKPVTALTRVIADRRAPPPQRRKAVSLLARLPGKVARGALWRVVEGHVQPRRSGSRRAATKGRASRRGPPERSALRAVAVAAWCAGPAQRDEGDAVARALRLVDHPLRALRAAAAHGLSWLPRPRRARDVAARRRAREPEARVQRALDAAIRKLDQRLGRGRAKRRPRAAGAGPRR